MKGQDAVIEPGIIYALRVFFAIQLVLSLLSLWSLLSPAREPAFASSITVTALRAALLTLLLLAVITPFLSRILQQFFLPAILVIAVVEVYAFLIGSLMVTGSGDRSMEDTIAVRAAQVIIVLLVPLIVAAWQYSYRAVIVYVIINALLMTGIVPLLLRDKAFSITLITLTVFQLMMYVVVGYMVAWLMSIQRRQRGELIEANIKVREYALALEQLAISRERNRLARELHDTLAHTLSGLSVQLEATDTLLDREPERARQLLRNALQSARSGMVDTRKALQALRAAPLADLGLILSIENLAKDIAERGMLKVDCRMPDRLPDLPVGADHVIYRVVQEGLTNIARHANAHHATIAIVPNDVLTVEISDDGDGFDPDAVDSSQYFGIRGMIERVSMIGGKLTITSEIGQGTTIHMELEYIHDKSAHQ